MLRWPVRSDCAPRTKNGQPPHSTTGVARTNCAGVADAAHRKMKQAEMSAHFDDKDRQREHERNPEPPRHVGEFGAIAGAAVASRLERHAADRAGARSRPAGSPDASGRYRSCPPARTRRAPWICSDIFPDRRRIWCGSRRRRNDSRGRYRRNDAGFCPDRPSCRRPDRSHPRHAPASHGRARCGCARRAREPNDPRSNSLACLLKPVPGRGI